MQLIEATSRQQLARDALTSEVWGIGLTPSQFIERERRLREHTWARRTMSSYWWVDEKGSALSSCELFLDAATVGTRRGQAGTVASVFTEKALRGRGHAAAMLKALEASVRAHSNVLALTLFSEIGVALYQRAGFFAVPSYDTFHSPLAEAPRGVELVEGVLPEFRPASSDTCLVTPLSGERLDWQLERERIYGELSSRPSLKFHGARVGNASITFTAYWRTNELQVLTFDARTFEEAAKLLDAARYAAHLAGLPTVRVWETSALPSQLAGAERRVRTDEIPMFLPIAPGIEAWTQVVRGTWA